MRPASSCGLRRLGDEVAGVAAAAQLAAACTPARYGCRSASGRRRRSSETGASVVDPEARRPAEPANPAVRHRVVVLRRTARRAECLRRGTPRSSRRGVGRSDGPARHHRARRGSRREDLAQPEVRSLVARELGVARRSSRPALPRRRRRPPPAPRRRAVGRRRRSRDQGGGRPPGSSITESTSRHGGVRIAAPTTRPPSTHGARGTAASGVLRRVRCLDLEQIPKIRLCSASRAARNSPATARNSGRGSEPPVHHGYP